MDVPDDEGSDSDIEESRPSKPRPTRNGIMTGTHAHNLLLMSFLFLLSEINSHHNGFLLLFYSGRGARFIGNMQGGDSDEVSNVSHQYKSLTPFTSSQHYFEYKT